MIYTEKFNDLKDALCYGDWRKKEFKEIYILYKDLEIEDVDLSPIIESLKSRIISGNEVYLCQLESLYLNLPNKLPKIVHEKVRNEHLSNNSYIKMLKYNISINGRHNSIHKFEGDFYVGDITPEDIGLYSKLISCFLCQFVNKDVQKIIVEQSNEQRETDFYKDLRFYWLMCAISILDKSETYVREFLGRYNNDSNKFKLQWKNAKNLLGKDIFEQTTIGIFRHVFFKMSRSDIALYYDVMLHFIEKEIGLAKHLYAEDNDDILHEFSKKVLKSTLLRAKIEFFLVLDTDDIDKTINKINDLLKMEAENTSLKQKLDPERQEVVVVPSINGVPDNSPNGEDKKITDLEKNNRELVTYLKVMFGLLLLTILLAFTIIYT